MYWEFVCCRLQTMHHVHPTDHEAAHLLQNAIHGLAYGAARSQLITIQHFSNVHRAVQLQVRPGAAA